MSLEHPRYAVCAGAALGLLMAWVGRAEAARLVLVGDVDEDLASEVLFVDDEGVALLDGPRLDEVRWRLALDTRGLVFAMAGDVDGDGLADLAVGDPARGIVTVYFGGADMRTTSIAGDVSGDGFGAGVAGVDLDGDARSELVIGSPHVGRVEVFQWEAERFVLVTAVDEGASVPGLGRDVQRAFDVDGDSLGDVIVRADDATWVFGLDVDSGLRMISVFDDRRDIVGLGDVDGDGLANVVWPFADEAAIGVGDVNGDFVADVLLGTSEGRRLVLGAANAQSPKEVWSGSGAWPIGDVDGDGYADIGWIMEDSPHPRIGIRYGGSELLGGPAIVARPPVDPTPPMLPAMPFDPGAVPVVTLAGGPDIDFDGFEGDLAIGLPFMDDGDLYRGPDSPEPESGMIVLLPGGTAAPGVSVVTTLAPLRANVASGFHYGAGLAAGSRSRTTGIVIGSPEERGRGGVRRKEWGSINLHEDYAFETIVGGRLGASVVLPGDLDGDGLADLAVADPGFSSVVGLEGAGRVRAFPGAPWTIDYRRALYAVTGTSANQALGLIAAAGDVDGDGLADLAVGSPNVDTVALLRLSAKSEKLVAQAIEDPTISSGHSLFGAAIAAGDFNGDGRTDLAIAAPAAGRVEVYLAAAAIGLTHRQTIHVGQAPLGATLAACDIDADGMAELVIGQPGYSGAFTREGRVEVYRMTMPMGLAQTFFGGRQEARLGTAITGLDRNHDGFCDIAMAALDGDHPPLIVVHLGNDGARGRPPRIGIRHPTSGETIAPWVRVGTRDVIGVSIEGRDAMPGQRTLEAEVHVALVDEAESRVGSERAASRFDNVVIVRDLRPSAPQSVRARVRWSAADAPFQHRSRWVRPNVQTPARVDVRTRANLPPVALDDTIRVDAGS